MGEPEIQAAPDVDSLLEEEEDIDSDGFEILWMMIRINWHFSVTSFYNLILNIFFLLKGFWGFGVLGFLYFCIFVF